MAKYFYPAVFHPETTGYSVSFPDLTGCFTQGESLEEASDMAFDAIGLYLENYLEKDYPISSNPADIKLSTNEFMVLIPFSPLAYQKKWNTKSVRKSLTLPAWLNELAEQQHINYSKILQEALKNKLMVNE